MDGAIAAAIIAGLFGIVGIFIKHRLNAKRDSDLHITLIGHPQTTRRVKDFSELYGREKMKVGAKLLIVLVIVQAILSNTGLYSTDIGFFVGFFVVCGFIGALGMIIQGFLES